jgi:hypothetical protein
VVQEPEPLLREGERDRVLARHAAQRRWCHAPGGSVTAS